MLDRLLRLVAPRQFTESVYTLNLDALAARGIRAIIFDLDNTLAPWRTGLPGRRLADWFGDLRARGFRACILSNAPESRVRQFTSVLGVPGMSKAGKPRAGAFRDALNLLEAAPDETAMVGDQLFTDVLGGNRLGLWTVLVVPVSGRDFPLTRLVRAAERFVLRALERRGWLSAG